MLAWHRGEYPSQTASSEEEHQWRIGWIRETRQERCEEERKGGRKGFQSQCQTSLERVLVDFPRAMAFSHKLPQRSSCTSCQYTYDAMLLQYMCCTTSLSCMNYMGMAYSLLAWVARLRMPPGAADNCLKKIIIRICALFLSAQLFTRTDQVFFPSLRPVVRRASERVNAIRAQDILPWKITSSSSFWSHWLPLSRHWITVQ